MCVSNALVAAGGTNLRRPLAYTGTASRWVRVPPGASFFALRARIITANEVTTSPVVRVYGAYTSMPPSGTNHTYPDDGSVQLARIDNEDVSGAGVTLAFPVILSDALLDGTYSYSSTYFPRGGATPRGEIRGASWLLVLVETAAVSSGATACEVQVTCY